MCVHSWHLNVISKWNHRVNTRARIYTQAYTLRLQIFTHSNSIGFALQMTFDIYVRSFDERLDFFLFWSFCFYLFANRTNATNQKWGRERPKYSPVAYVFVFVWNEAESWIDLQNCVYVIGLFWIYVFAEHFSAPLQQSKKRDFYSHCFEIFKTN